MGSWGCGVVGLWGRGVVGLWGRGVVGLWGLVFVGFGGFGGFEIISETINKSLYFSGLHLKCIFFNKTL